jgi:hypothetical protein
MSRAFLWITLDLVTAKASGDGNSLCIGTMHGFLGIMFNFLKSTVMKDPVIGIAMSPLTHEW